MQYEERVVYLDMDGVLCDFEKGVELFAKQKLGKTKSISDLKQMELLQLVNLDGYLFYANMPALPDADKLIDFVTNNFTDVRILSSVSGLPPSEPRKRGKMKWLESRGLTNEFKEILFTEHSGDKKHYAKADDILIDDYKSNILEWNAAGGIGIQHKTAEHTISQLQQYV